ncbi:MAG: DNA repair protein RadC [Bacteroidia bacterium]|jgi:DNA repair protein RadC
MTEETLFSNLPIKHWAEDDRPREKMQLKGRTTLSDTELISLLIATGNRNESAVDLAKKLMRQSGNSLNNLARFSLADLQKVKGIGQAKAISIVAALELGRRRKTEEALDVRQFTNSRDCFDLLHPVLSDLMHEEFWVLLLNRNNRYIIHRRVSEGGVSGTVVDAKIIFKLALEQLASTVILCHNHPSGNITPSQADNKLTQQLKEAGKLLDILVADHLIIAGNAYFSFSDEGLM